MQKDQFSTSGGLHIEVIEQPAVPAHALSPIFEGIDSQKGGVFSSGFDYPGRHSRWDIGFLNPALEFICIKREFVLQALNPQGQAILKAITPQLAKLNNLETFNSDSTSCSGQIAPPPKFFPEEDRSRQPSVFSVLRKLAEMFHSTAPLAGHFGLYGAFGYDLVTQFEDIELKLDRAKNIKDCHLFLPLEITVVDRKRETASHFTYSVKTPDGYTASLNGGGNKFSRPTPSGSSEVICDHAPGEFAEKVEKVIAGTKRGDYFEVVLSQTFETRFDETPTAVFKRLSEINPSPYMFLLNFGDEQIVGASPELFVRVTGKRYETCPIAGTIARGETALEDAARVQELIGSRKDESELTMCTDVDRNDMARVCKPGSVKVIGRRQLEFYSHLIHTVDHLEGYLRDGLDALDAFQTHMWACTVTGAPKPAALQEIENLEKSPRGWYSGAIGFLSFSGNLNTGITLRTAHLKNGRAAIRAGATLLFGSDPAMEEQETRTKAAAFLAALARPQEQVQPTIPDSQKDQGSFIERLTSRKRVLLIDYKDSFVHNLAAYLRELNAEVITMRAGFPEEMLEELKPHLILLSPGPGSPEEFGIPQFIQRLVKQGFPIFGVCLGHQGIGQSFGGTIAQLPIPEHGKASKITHNNSGIFSGIPNYFEAGRYHSLYIKADSMPDCLEITASTIREELDGENELIPMAIQHKTLPIAGVQFHPESLMTLKQRAGHRILKNALSTLC